MAPERKIRLRLFGEFVARAADGKLARFDTRRCAEVLAFVAARDGRAVRRVDLAETVWGTPDDRHRASLRNALSSVRRSLGSPAALLSDRETVSLGVDLCESDVAQARALQRKTRLAAHSRTLEKGLRDLSNLLKTPFLEGWEMDWVLSERAYWEAQLEESLALLGESMEAEGRYEEALRLAAEALDRSPLNEVAAARAMRCAAELGDDAGAQSIFEMHTAAVADSGDQLPSAALARMADVIRDGLYPRHGAARDFDDPSEQDAIVGAFERSLRSGGDEALRFIASNTNHWVRSPNPQAALSVLEKCLAAAGSPSAARCEVAFAASFLAMLLTDYQKAEALLLLAKDDAAHMDSASLTTQVCARLGFYYLEVRDPASARRAFAEGMARLDDVEELWIQAQFKNSYAGFIWHEGDSGEAFRIYRSIHDLPAIQELDQPRSAAMANLSILSGEEEEWAAAVRFGEEALRIARARGNAYAEAGALTGIGVGQCGLGDREPGLATLTDCLGVAHRRGYRRVVAMSLDKVAVGWMLLDRADLANWTFVAAEVLRERIGHPRSVAEGRVAKRYRAASASTLADGPRLRRTPFDAIVRRACDLLSTSR